jgi:hypothetical protein
MQKVRYSLSAYVNNLNIIPLLYSLCTVIYFSF